MCTCAKTMAGTPCVSLIGCVPWGISLFFEVGWLILALNLSGVQPNRVPWLGSVCLHSGRWTSLQEIFIISSESEEFQPQAKAVLCKALQRQRETLPGSTVNKQVKSGSRNRVKALKWFIQNHAASQGILWVTMQIVWPSFLSSDNHVLLFPNPQSLPCHSACLPV